MLDDFGNELENTESKMDSTMKKMAKVLHMNNGNFISHGLNHCRACKDLPFYTYIFFKSTDNYSVFVLCFSDKRQWIAIGVLSLILFIVILLFILL